MTRRSPAKINWNLRVLRRRPDGFHEIASLVSPVTLYDELALETAQAPGVALTCDRADLPCDERNLVVRAAWLLAERAGIEPRLCGRLTKRIPMGGGLGGGSSNGALALTMLSELWGLGWGRAALWELAARLGSDVPFFLLGGSGILRGRGERVDAACVDFRGWIVLLFPPFSISTAAVYGAYRPNEAMDGEVEPAAGLDATAWMRRAFNNLEAPALAVCPALGDVMRGAQELAARPVRMSGSGSSLFTAFDESEQAGRFAHDAMRRLGLETCIVQVADTPGPSA